MPVHLVGSGLRAVRPVQAPAARCCAAILDPTAPRYSTLELPPLPKSPAPAKDVARLAFERLQGPSSALVVSAPATSPGAGPNDDVTRRLRRLFRDCWCICMNSCGMLERAARRNRLPLVLWTPTGPTCPWHGMSSRRHNRAGWPRLAKLKRSHGALAPALQAEIYATTARGSLAACPASSTRYCSHSKFATWMTPSHKSKP